MRLIDADALFEALHNNIIDDRDDAIWLVNNAQTIEPQKQWVGLSDDEIFALCPYIDHDLLEEAFYRGARAIETKLKELNYES